VACFTRDIAGALGLHRAAIVQYLRPEIPAFCLGAFIAALAFGEFRPRTGSSPIVRFLLGMFAMIGALVFLGCPWRAMLRLAGGDWNAILGIAGLSTGIGAGVLFLRGGFSLGRSYPARAATGLIMPLLMAVLLVLAILYPVFGEPGKAALFQSEKGPGAMAAPIFLSILVGLVIGFLAQRTRFCTVGAFRDFIDARFPLVQRYRGLSRSRPRSEFGVRTVPSGLHVGRCGGREGDPATRRARCPLAQLRRHNAVGLAGLAAGLRHVLGRGVGEIRAQEEALTKRLIDGLGGIRSVCVHGTRDARRQTAVVSFTMDHLSPAEVALALDERFEIMCRPGLHCAPRAHVTLATWHRAPIAWALHGASEYRSRQSRRSRRSPELDGVPEFAVILVHSTSHAVYAERVLRQAGLAARMIPTPRHLSSDCGPAVRIGAEAWAAAEKALRAAGLEFDRIEKLE
jgi:hypothetical protein